MKKGFIFGEIDKERRKEEESQKEAFSADLTIAFVLVTVLSVPCSFGGWSVQIRRFKKGEFWVPVCVEYVPRDLLSLASSAIKIPCYIVGVRGRKGVSLKNVRTCGGTADVVIAARD